jgi:hypothetical protein
MTPIPTVEGARRIAERRLATAGQTYPRLELKPQERRLLSAMWRYYKAHGYWPSMRDLMAAKVFSSTSVAWHWRRALERKGLMSQHVFMLDRPGLNLRRLAFFRDEPWLVTWRAADAR